MKEVTKYQADDGSTWGTKDEAIKQDELVVALESALAHLKPRPKWCDFENGKGFVQHEKGAYAKAEMNLRKVYNDRFPGMIGLYTPMSCNIGILMRYACDSSNRSMQYAFGRLNCICPRTDREFGQPYFVSHQEEVSE